MFLVIVFIRGGGKRELEMIAKIIQFYAKDPPLKCFSYESILPCFDLRWDYMYDIPLLLKCNNKERVLDRKNRKM